MDSKQKTITVRVKPRIIIHGGAGNVTRSALPPDLVKSYRHALLTIITKTNSFMTTPLGATRRKAESSLPQFRRLPSALETATYAVSLLEDDPHFNSGHGAVFTRDGINELEASVMVSRGYKKRAVGVSGVRRLKNPIQLATKILEAGEEDLDNAGVGNGSHADVPSAQGHGHLHGEALTQTLAVRYGLELVDPHYYFTQRRWDEHQRSLDLEKREGGFAASWSPHEYLPQGTCGAVALDEEGIVCVATSTGGITNKLSGRIGDTPTVGAGFWAGEWDDGQDAVQPSTLRLFPGTSAGVSLGNDLLSFLADCLPSPRTYKPLAADVSTTTRAFAASGTGNGDSFLRTAAVRSVAARAQWKPESCAQALSAITGPGGELERSAGNRFGRTGEGEGGMIGIELVVGRNVSGEVQYVRSEILKDCNCGGMFRAWMDDVGKAQVRVFRDDTS